MPARGRIWIDLDNSPHVPFFAPILEELRQRGYSTLVTARDCFQVRELADLFHLDYKLIGHHSGKNRVRKIAGLCRRALQLTPTVFQAQPDLAVSHGSRAQLIVAAALGIPCLIISDYEFSTGWVVIHPTWYMCPEVIPKSAAPFDPNRVLQYPGIKEDVYVPRFVPDPRVRSQLGLREQDLVVTLRPPASEAHYHNPESDRLFEAVVEFLIEAPHVKLVLLPRNERQAAALRTAWAGRFANGAIRIPNCVVDGLNLIWHSDLVVSGGGTMNREAAALGVPVYSVFRGQIGAVDQYLSTKGRLVLLENVGDVKSKIRIVRRNPSARLQHGAAGALGSIVGHIDAIMRATAPACAAPSHERS